MDLDDGPHLRYHQSVPPTDAGIAFDVETTDASREEAHIGRPPSVANFYQGVDKICAGRQVA